jgi:TonB-linked SusC/RagA family outer membrane protein
MTSDRSVFLNSNILTYNKTFEDKHEISALAGTELLSQTGRSATTTGILFPGDEYTYLTSAGLIIDGSSYYSENALFSFFSQIHYKYKNKFMASVSGRYDGSSRFGKNKKYGFFPAISGSWRITEESFFKSLSWLDDLKLRVSYGLTGNERFGNFLYLGTWGATTAYNGVPSVVPANLENPDLHWEATTELNAGLDISVFSGRIQSSIDVYYNTTSDLILDETLPYTTGFGSVKGNLGKITNQGFEFALTTVNIDNVLRWSSQFNISQNQNTVKELATDQPIYSGYNTYTNSTHIIAVGSTLGTFWGLEFLGVDPGTGDAIYKDLNNDGRINADDAKIIGDAEPLFHGGFTNTIKYKNFDFNIFFQFSYGNEMINFGDATSLINSGADIQNNQSKKALKRWQKPGDITSVPKYEYENTSNSWFSSRFVEDASYVRLKNITLGYRIPSKYINRIRLKSARVYATATNILTFTNYSGADPEVNSFDGSTAAQGLDLFTFPQVKTIMFGLKLEF